jgi:hypothetical protein
VNWRTCPDVTPNQPRDDEGKPVSADQDAKGLGPAAEASYRDDTPQPHRPARDPGGRVPGTPGTGGSRRRPAGRIRVAGTGTAPMSTTEYQEAVEAVAVLIARRDARRPHAEAA